MFLVNYKFPRLFYFEKTEARNEWTDRRGATLNAAPYRRSHKEGTSVKTKRPQLNGSVSDMNSD